APPAIGPTSARRPLIKKLHDENKGGLTMRNHGTLAQPLIETCGLVFPAVNHSPIVYWTKSLDFGDDLRPVFDQLKLRVASGSEPADRPGFPRVCLLDGDLPRSANGAKQKLLFDIRRFRFLPRSRLSTLLLGMPADAPLRSSSMTSKNPRVGWEAAVQLGLRLSALDPAQGRKPGSLYASKCDQGCSATRRWALH